MNFNYNLIVCADIIVYVMFVRTVKYVFVHFGNRKHSKKVNTSF